MIIYRGHSRPCDVFINTFILITVHQLSISTLSIRAQLRLLSRPHARGGSRVRLPCRTSVALQRDRHITLRPNSTPVCLYTARKIAHPLLPQIKSELQSMVRQEIISAVTVPTQWCSGMVPVPKENGSVRICVDLTQLNKSVQREIHPMSSVDESLAKLGSSKIFTKLDANSGFWQLPLDDESRLLTTFITPYGRYCFNRLPFGISSAPEIFQRTMSIILEGLDGVICHMDDILVHSVDETTHNHNVRAVLSRLQEAGLTLNAN